MSIRFRLRWSLRCMVLVCIGCGVVGGWLGRMGHNYRLEQDIVQHLQNSKGCAIAPEAEIVTENNQPLDISPQVDWNSWASITNIAATQMVPGTPPINIFT